MKNTGYLIFFDDTGSYGVFCSHDMPENENDEAWDIYPLQWEESDSFHHCEICHCMLDNSLTPDGVNSVLESALDEFDLPVELLDANVEYWYDYEFNSAQDGAILNGCENMIFKGKQVKLTIPTGVIGDILPYYEDSPLYAVVKDWLDVLTWYNLPTSQDNLVKWILLNLP